ncbi:ferrochelatase [Lysobacter sp. A286]
MNKVGTDTALVLVNLGTPAAPTAAAIRRYLGEFLGDRRVVSLPRWFWLPLLHGLILPLRAPKVAPKYASVWMDEGSPLAVHTRRLAEAVQREMPGVRVIDTMRYGEPSLAQVLQRLSSEGIQRALVLPLYPQYSTTTTASVADVVARAGSLPLRMVQDYHLDAGWVDAVASSIRAHRAQHGASELLLFSFHGLPQRLVDAGDPYQRQCEAGAQAIAAALGLDEAQWGVSYQSRFGRERWLEPATANTLVALADRGVRKVDIVAPGFAADCLETLEEIAIMLAEDFAARGGRLRYIPCLNDNPAHAAALAAIARRELEAWV